jgi:hypothetical protein
MVVVRVLVGKSTRTLGRADLAYIAIIVLEITGLALCIGTTKV